MPSKKKIILAVCGSIAAYKTIELSRRLVENNFNVTVVLTPSALEFTAKLPYQIFTENEPIIDMFSSGETTVKHVELANNADLLLVTAATANSIAKFSHGIADNFLTTLYLARKKELKTIIVPAMNNNMWQHPATENNVKTLQKRGVEFWGPDKGKLACGSGEGRMIEIQEILEKVAIFFHEKKKNNKKLVIVTGSTKEYIDPIRYISNDASGKTGIELAKNAYMRGYDVSLIGGNLKEHVPLSLNYTSVKTFHEMEKAVLKETKKADILIMSAAIGDYSPVKPSSKKIKKNDEQFISLQFEKNSDITAKIRKKYPKLFIVGFCAETEELEKNAEKKIAKKGLNMVCANLISPESTPFGTDENELLIINNRKKKETTKRCSKEKLAEIIMNSIEKELT
ncbi:MAG: bifunctional phosphopantothenoylcysteine decarboxylase/phosphopantothenate--cysteine ligase CoaBC [Nitrospinae bacterium]|nr:bifunctional phosphopantothenoylcysteine decarboxylase/phosphopantothenate--cysteine ligase CoaBC [Nitrospinota bacterium]